MEGNVESARVRALIDWLAARQREAWERSSDEQRAMRNKEKAA